MLSWCCQYECAYYDGAYHCKSCGAKRIMSRIWEPQPIEVYKSWLSAIEDEASDQLNAWESNFIDSISARLAKNNQLSQAQAEKLESIYAEKTK